MGRNHQVGPKPNLDPPTEEDIAQAKKFGHDLSHLAVLPARDLPKPSSPGDLPITPARLQAIRTYASGILSGFCSRMGLIDPGHFDREQLARYRKNAFDMAEAMLAEEEARYDVA